MKIALNQWPNLLDHYMVIAGDDEKALVLTTTSNPVSFVSTRLRLNSGKISAYVLRKNKEINSSTVQVQITTASESIALGNSSKEHSVRFRGNEIKMLFLNDMGLKGYIKRVIVNDIGSETVILELTPRISNPPYLGFKSERPFVSVNVNVEI